MLKEDIVEYGTLSDFTIRRIANLDGKSDAQIIGELRNLMDQLGDDYLTKQKELISNIPKEVIIAIENQ